MDFLWTLFGWPGILLPLSALAAYVLSSRPYAALNVLRKIRLAMTGLLHMLLSRDKKNKVSRQPAVVVSYIYRVCV